MRDLPCLRSSTARRVLKMLWDYYPEKVSQVRIGENYEVTFQPVSEDSFEAIVAFHTKTDLSGTALKQLYEMVDETLNKILEPYLSTLTMINMLYAASLIGTDTKGESAG